MQLRNLLMNVKNRDSDYLNRDSDYFLKIGCRNNSYDFPETSWGNHSKMGPERMGSVSICHRRIIDGIMAIAKEQIVAVPIFVLILTILPVLNASAEIIEGVVAIVNDQMITYSELEEFLAPHLLYFEGGFPEWVVEEKIARIRKEVLEELIKEKILLSEARKESIVVQDEEVEKYLMGVKERFGSEEKFQLQLSKEKLTEEGFKQRLGEQILIRKFVDLGIGSKIRALSTEEMREFFEENKESFVEPERVAVNQITVEVKGETKWLEAGKKAEDIHARLMKGEDFSTLAKKYSDASSRDEGGNLEFINRTELLPEFEKAISTLEVGEISNIIRTETGFHIIKLESRKEARQREFSEVRREIENQLYRLRMEQALSKWIEELKEKSYIQIIEITNEEDN